MCPKEFCFPDCWKVSSVVPGLKNVGERSTTKSYCPVSRLSVVRQIFEKLVNNNLVDHHEKCGLFSNSQYGFRYSRSTASLLTVVSDRVVWRLLELCHLIYSRLSTGVRRAVVFFTNSGFMEFHVGYLASFHLFSLIDGFTWFRVGSPHKNIQLMLESLKVQFLVI